MKYYSEKISEAEGKPAVFGTQKELEEAERAFDGKRALEARKADERKADAKKVEEAYRHSLDVRRKATKEIEEADKAYREERSKFVGKYGSYHMTYTEGDGKGLLSFGDLWDDFFERLFL